MAKWNIENGDSDYNKSYYKYIDNDGVLHQTDISEDKRIPESIIKDLVNKSLNNEIKGYQFIHDNIGMSFKYYQSLKNLNHVFQSSEEIEFLYQKNRNRIELNIIISTLCQTRKYGFPIICTISEKNDQLIWAAKLLLCSSNLIEIDQLPDDFNITKNSSLYHDARNLVERAISNMNHN